MTKSDIFKQLSDIFLKKILGAIVLASICLPIKSDIKEDRKAYLRQYSETAVNEMYRSGIPASITLGQGLLESAAGKSFLAVKGNNHFFRYLFPSISNPSPFYNHYSFSQYTYFSVHSCRWHSFFFF